MSKRRDIFIGIAAIVVIAVAAAIWFVPGSGERAPDVTFTTLDGEEIRLSDRAGKPTLITFWATTCATCVQEMPYLKAMYEELGPRGLEIIGVAMDYDPIRDVERLVDARELNYRITHDSDGEIASAFGGVRLTPTTFLIGPRGDIVQRRLGLIDMERLHERVSGMLPAES
ncbi:TlpA family protein disulfide reductase [Methylonatrum kenyense]|uniref:TlpA disulfide reductase family protein n=1 Tax=Methylonatrum kenyense TaxID=455253 RepID=UPI0020C0D345|nr:TlpA disulfide reductase family protein [Methylonatrum kenyense]MCK8517173.1 TlpA family protein disulfide reductase [Methylonatrum kenyense]